MLFRSGWVQPRGRDLVEERLEGVVVLPVEKGDLDRSVSQSECCVESSESTADYDNTRRLRRFLSRNQPRGRALVVVSHAI